MKTLGNFGVVGISILLVVGLGACDNPEPAQTAGKKIDQSVEKAGIKMGEVANKVGEKLEAQGEKAGLVIADAEITAKIKAAIFAEPGLRTLQISVDTVKGVVTITGSVDSQSNSDRAKTLAAAVDGVKDVENRLVLK